MAPAKLIDWKNKHARQTDTAAQPVLPTTRPWTGWDAVAPGMVCRCRLPLAARA